MAELISLGYPLGMTELDQCSQGAGGPGSQTGTLQRRLDRTVQLFSLHQVLGDFGIGGLSEDR